MPIFLLLQRKIEGLGLSSRKRWGLMDWVASRQGNNYKRDVIISTWKDIKSNMDHKRPLLLSRTTPTPEGLKVVAEYEIGKMVSFGGEERMNRVRQLWSAYGNKNTGKEFLLKTIPNTAEHQREIEQTINEVTYLKTLSIISPSTFLTFNTLWQDQSYIYVLFQPCNYGSLHELISYCKLTKRPMKGSHILYFLKKMLEAVKVLHEHGLVHRKQVWVYGSVKAEYVIIDEDVNVKVRGLGLTKLAGKEEDRSQIKGTPYCLPPEYINIHEYDQKSDIWAIGVLTYYMFQGEFPFILPLLPSETQKKKKTSSLFQQIIEKQFSFNYQPKPSKEESDILSLLTFMLQKRSINRKNVDELLCWDVFKDIENKQQQLKEDIKRDYRVYFEGLKENQWTYSVQEQQRVEEKQKKMQETAYPLRKVRVVKAVRLPDFGFFLKLSNQIVIAYFNDHSILNFSVPPTEIDPKLDYPNKVNILNFVSERYMKEQSPTFDYFSQSQQWEPQCSISKLFFKDNALFVRLTNDTFQIFIHPQSEKNKEFQGEFDQCVTLNNHVKNAEEVWLDRGGERIRFSSWQEGINHQLGARYLDFVGRCLTTLHEHSQVSFQAAEMNMTNIQPHPSVFPLPPPGVKPNPPSKVTHPANNSVFLNYR